MPDKLDQSSVDYRKGEGDRRCDNCTMFRGPASCTDVKGPIKPDGLCDIFDRKTASEE